MSLSTVSSFFFSSFSFIRLCDVRVTAGKTETNRNKHQGQHRNIDIGIGNYFNIIIVTKTDYLLFVCRQAAFTRLHFYRSEICYDVFRAMHAHCTPSDQLSILRSFRSWISVWVLQCQRDICPIRTHAQRTRRISTLLPENGKQKCVFFLFFCLFRWLKCVSLAHTRTAILCLQHFHFQSASRFFFFFSMTDFGQ